MNLNDYLSLGLPVNSEGQLEGILQNIEHPNLLTYSGTYFKPWGGGAYEFICPDGGAVSSANTTFARSELRGLDRDLTQEHFMNVNCRLLTRHANFISNKTLTIAQLHGGSSPSVGNVVFGSVPIVRIGYAKNSSGVWLKIFLKDGTYDENEDLIDESISVKTVEEGENTKIHIHWWQDNGLNYLDVTLDNMPILAGRRMFWTAGTGYYKNGAYWGNNDKLGNLASVVQW